MAPGFLLADAVRDAAIEFPDRRFLLLDEVALDHDGRLLPNVACAVFAEHEGAFLAGVVAGLKAKADGKDAVGFIGGERVPFVERHEAGFAQGVRAVFPGARVELRDGSTIVSGRDADRDLLAEFDAAGRPIERRLKDGPYSWTSSYSFHPSGRVRAIFLETKQFSPYGIELSASAEQSATVYVYDAGGRLVRRETKI